MSNEGKRVRAHYTGTFDDGTVFDSSVERGEPLEFVCMAGQMIPGFDAAVKEMEVGETKNVHLPASEAYGEPMTNSWFRPSPPPRSLAPKTSPLASASTFRALADSPSLPWLLRLPTKP